MAFFVDDLDRAEQAEIDDQPAVVGAEARERMATAPNRELQTTRCGVLDGLLHIRHGEWPEHCRRLSIDKYGPPRGLVRIVVRANDVAGKTFNLHDIPPCLPNREQTPDAGRRVDVT
ncbi:hypothetical protein GCM10009804_29480 [Kribbella hippodromi]|uniref:Uncharacterized protein n=1 Tax=Kribbella hippodromi TaxID=434347 RepID=A0ABN2D6Y4_9ACTN